MKEKNNSLPEEMSQFFDQRVSLYDNYMKQVLIDSFETFYEKVTDAVEPTDDNIHVLDLGSGTGIELKEILTRAPHARITCVDVSSKMMDELKRKYAEHKEQIEIIQGSFLEISFPGFTFDYIVSVQAMHHYTYPQKLSIYSNIYRFLNIGGKYIEGDYVVSPEEEQMHLAALEEKLSTRVILPYVLYHIDIPFSVNTQRQLLQESGFSQVEVLFSAERVAIISANKG